VLGKLARQHDPNVLVGFDHADDAGVYQIAPDLALVQTVDFFTPIVDDPYSFGQIAATNSLSDVYAMGGRPLTSLALVCFPEKGNLEILERILAGGLSKMMEAGCTVVGGHSLRDDETKFGYSVTGVIHPKRIFANQGAVPGDRLLFTKALGTGVISTAIKKGRAQSAWIDVAVRSMTTLNKSAADVIAGGIPAHIDPDAPVRAAGRSPATLSQVTCSGVELRSTGQTRASAPTWSVHSMTDITGFGLIGHAREMARASNVSLKIYASRIPLLVGAIECVRKGHIPGGLKANRDFAECMVGYASGIPDEVKALLFDPQTAGGFLISVAAEQAVDLRKALEAAGVPATEIGEVTTPTQPVISVVA